MLNRRLIRVKVFQALYAYVQDDEPSLNRSKKYLHDSITGIHQNFLTVFLFPLELIHFIRTQTNPDELRYVKDELSTKRYQALSLNGLYEYLVRQPAVASGLKKPPHAWAKDQGLLRSFHQKLKDHSITEKLLKDDFNDFQTQLRFMKRMFDFLRDSEEFDSQMEEIEMLWEDEKTPIYKAIRNTFTDIDLESDLPFPIVDEKDEEGLEYAEELLTTTIRHMSEYGELIDKNAPGWDRDRIAITDMMLMTMALAELMHFPYIPVKVTLNEYLELAKNYSTPQSSKFVNGVLDKLVKLLEKDGKLAKKGRGMIG